MLGSAQSGRSRQPAASAQNPAWQSARREDVRFCSSWTGAAQRRSVIVWASASSGSSSGQRIATGYTAMKLGIAGVALVVAGSPWLPFSWSLGYDHQLLLLLAARLLPVLAAVQSLAGAAVHDRLASGTYQRLNAGLLLLLGIAVAASWSVLSVQALPVRLAWVTVVSLVSTLCLQVQGGQGNVLQSLESAVRSISDAATSAFAMSGINSAAYALGAIGAAFAALTDWTQLTDGVALTAAGQASQAWPGQMIAATSVFATIVLLVLKDAGERGRLGASTFKSLNAALAASSAAVLLVIHRWSTRATMPSALVVHAVLAAYLFVLCGYHRITARK